VTAPLTSVSKTPADCSQQSQYQLDGCAWNALNAANKKINAEVLFLMKQEGTVPGVARAIVASEKVWMNYVNVACSAVDAEFKGGSRLPMADAECRAAVDANHSRDLYRLWQTMNAEPGPYPKFP
jgi:uncharacterized protein YecT (DUF1311 family)